MGETLLALLPEFSKELDQVLASPADHINREQSVFFSTGLGHHMVSYTWSMAYLLHLSPIVISLLLPALQSFTAGKAGGMGLLAAYQDALASFLWCSLTFTVIVSSCAIAGALRAGFSGLLCPHMFLLELD